MRGVGLAGFAGRSSLRSWLYTSRPMPASIRSRGRPRVLPVDFGPAAIRTPRRARRSWTRCGSARIRAGMLDSAWLAAPVARYEQREAVELAFVAALQHLPPRPAGRADPARRARLLGCGDGGGPATTTIASVNSALQRARAAVEERCRSAPSRQPCGSWVTRASRRSWSGTSLLGNVGDVEAFAAMLHARRHVRDAPAGHVVLDARGDRDLGEAIAAVGGVGLADDAHPREQVDALAFYAWDEQAQAYIRRSR